MPGHTWEKPEKYQTWTANQANQNEWPEGNPEEMPHKRNSNCHEGATQGFSPFESAHESIHTYNNIFVLLINICFTTFHVCENYFPQSQRAKALVTDHWSSG